MKQEIFQMLQQSPGTLYSAKEIGKRLDRDRFKQEPHWALPHLKSLVGDQLIVQDDSGHFYFPKPRID